MKSSPECILEISEEAYDDLVSIQNYTYSKHGENQWREYGIDLDKGMTHILEHPFSGHTREDIPDGYQTSKVRGTCDDLSCRR